MHEIQSSLNIIMYSYSLFGSCSECHSSPGKETDFSVFTYRDQRGWKNGSGKKGKVKVGYKNIMTIVDFNFHIRTRIIVKLIFSVKVFIPVCFVFEIVS
jgi:hypothetical protein